MQPKAIIARFGGDEFVALFQDLADRLVEAEALARRLPAVVASRSSSPVSVFTTTSIGSPSPTIRAQPESVLARPTWRCTR